MSQVERYRRFIESVESSLEYKVEVAALSFVDEVTRSMAKRRVNKAELARRLGTSRAYTSKLLRGDANFTLATMVKIADVLSEELHLHVADAGASVRWYDVLTGEAGSTMPEPIWPQATPTHTYRQEPTGDQPNAEAAVSA